MNARFAAILILAAICAHGAAAGEHGTARATLTGSDGTPFGTAELTAVPNGVLIRLDLSGLPPGEHAVHFHETGVCDAADGFASSGGHFGPGGTAHGFLSPGGPHAGDMPNQVAGPDGTLRATLVNPNVRLDDGPTGLLDADGSALVIHEGADDYRSQPSGDAGGRLACAVIAAPE